MISFAATNVSSRRKSKRNSATTEMTKTTESAAPAHLPTQQSSQKQNAPTMDWGTTVRPLLAASYGNLSTSELLKLARTLTNSRQELLSHGAEFAPFYSSLVALSAHFLSGQISNVARAQLSTMTGACRVIIEYLMTRLDVSDDAHRAVGWTQLGMLVKGLCTGQACLHRSDVITLVARMKSSQLPTHIRNTIGPDKSEDDGTSPKLPRPRATSTGRSDPLGAVFDSLVSPLTGIHSDPGHRLDSDSIDKDSSTSNSADVKELFVSTNIQHLLRFETPTKFLDMFLSAQSIGEYVDKYNAFVDGAALALPDMQNSDACTAIEDSLPTLSADLSLLEMLLDLPLFCSISEGVVAKMCKAVSASVLAAASVVLVRHRDSLGADESDEESRKQHKLDGACRSIASTALYGIHRRTSTMVALSPNVDSSRADSFNAASSLLLGAIVDHMNSVIVCPTAVVLEFSERLLAVAPLLMRCALTDMGSRQYSPAPDGGWLDMPTSAAHKLTSVCARIPLVPLFIRMARGSLVQTITNQQMQIDAEEATANVDAQDSTDDSDNERTAMSPLNTNATQRLSSHGSAGAVVANSSIDSEEPILGTWLEDLLSNVPALVDEAIKAKRQQSLRSGRRSTASESLGNGTLRDSFPSEKRLLNLCCDALRALNNNLIGGSSVGDNLHAALCQSVTSETVERLSDMILRLYFHTSKNVEKARDFRSIRTELARFVHNALVNKYMTDQLQNELVFRLLDHDLLDGDEWPLSIPPPVLTVLGQTLFLRIHSEQDHLGRSNSDAVVVGVWTRFINALDAAVRRGLNNVTEMPETPNVEHVQLLLLLFHALQLMQKKALLLQVAGTVAASVADDSEAKFLTSVRVSPHLGQLLLILDYMLRHLYEPSPVLLEQAQINVFPDQTQTDVDLSQLSLAHEAFADASVVKCFSSSEKNNSPTIYELTKLPVDGTLPPKVDGLAINFLLSWSGYDGLYNALIKLTDVHPLDGANNVERACVRYARTLAWRCAGLLPPSVGLFQQAETDVAHMDVPLLAHLLRIEPRLQSSAYCKSLSECLVKQDVAEADALVKIERAKELLSQDFVVNACRVLLERTKIVLKTENVDRPQVNFALCMTAELALRRLSLHFAKYQTGTDIENKPSPAERSVASVVLGLVQQLGASARGLIAREAISKSADEPLDAEMATELLSMATNASSSPYNLDSWPQLLQCMPSALRLAIGNWDKVSDQFIKNEKNKATMNDDLLSAPSIEKQLSSVVFGDSELSDSVMCSLAATYKSACDLLMHLTAVFRSGSGDCFSLQQVEDAMLGVMFTLVTRPADAENACVSLTKYAELHGQSKEYCEERQMYHFLTHIIRLLGMHSDSDTTWHSGLVPLVCERLCKMVKSASNWTVVTNFFRQSPDGANLTPSLLKRYERGQTTPLTTIAFMRLVSDMLDQLTNPQGKASQLAMLSELHRVMIEPLLRSEQLLRQWIVVYKSTLADECKMEPWFLSLLSNSMHLLDDMSEAWAVDSAKSLLNAVIDELLDAVPKKMPPLPEGLHLPKSDRWLYSALTPVRVDGSDCPLPATQLDQRFCSVFVLCVQMANAHDGIAHVRLLALCKKWILELGKRITTPAVLALMEGVEEPIDTDLRAVADVDTAALILSYIGALIEAVKTPTSRLSSANLDYDSDWAPFDLQMDVVAGGFNEEEIGEDDESGVEDSGEESADSMDERTCTFTRTQKEFMNQHWYHCHTCGMVDGEGVCTTCAKVCHKDHDMSYSKFGSFFCDCGARADGRCQALLKRARRRTKPSTQPSQSGASAFAASSRPTKPSTLKSTTAGRPPGMALRQSGNMCTLSDYLGVTLHVSRNALSAAVRQTLINELTDATEATLCQNLLRTLSFVIPMLTKGIEQRSSGAAFLRHRLAMEWLHGDRPITIHTDRRLFTPMFCSQGAVFDGVKLNLAGEQGQVARQLMQQSQTLHRSPIALINFADKKRQFVAVTYDRCKLAVVQASSLMKQVESKRRKLQLTRVALETMPFTVINLSSQDECVAVCGVKECTVLVFSSSGTIADRIQLAPALDAGNLIIKAEWCPGVRGLLALVTADFISVYDLKLDSTKPRHQFVIPVGNMRDVSFVVSETGEQTSLLIMSSVGYVYMQQLNEQCLLEDDASFFVTNSIMIDHTELTENQGTISGGGISVHYSHVLKLVFAGYAQGKNLVFPFDDPSRETITNATLLPTLAKKPDGSPLEQPLVGWTECAEHPGVVTAVSHTSFSPYVVYCGPKSLYVDELPLANKLRVFCVPIKPVEGASAALHLLALGEDGALQVFEASTSHLLDYWLVPPPQAVADQLTFGPMSSPRPVASKRRVRVKSSGPVVLPVDFFESCTEMRDVLFSSRELQHNYEPAQIKNRLATNNLYVACSATNGFELVIRSIDPNMVICGLRVELGKTMVERTPTYVQLCGRRREIRIVRPRWFDLPMTRDETLSTPEQMTIRFGASASGGMCIVDSVKVYGKTKEAFGWTEEADESVKERAAMGVSPPRVVWAGSTEPGNLLPLPPAVVVSRPLLPEVFLMASLKVLDRYFDTFPNGTDNRKSAIDLTTGLLPTVVHPSAMVLVKSVLRRLFPSKEQYCAHKDRFLLLCVWKSLALVERDRDWDLFDRLLLITREVAIYRPVNLLVFSKEIVAMSPEKSAQNMGTLIESLMRILWKLIRHTSANLNQQAVVGEPPVAGNRAVTIRCLVDVLHAFMRTDPDVIPVVAVHLTSLLLCEDVEIGQHCKLALLSIFRPKSRGKKRVVIPSPPLCTSPGPLLDLTNSSASDMQQLMDAPDAGDDEGDSDNDASIELDALASGQAQEAAAVLLQAAEMAAADDDDTETEDDGSGGHQDHYELLAAAANGGQLEQLLADAPDDDAAMMELAIALSLQESGAGGGGAGQQNQPPPPPSASVQPVQALEEEQAQMSDTTVDGESGDEEGSTAATDGSNLRTSPTVEERSSCPEPPGSCAASESGASGGSVSGRSSTYGETGAEPNAAVTTTMERDGPTSEPPLKSLADKCADAQHKTTIELQSRLLLALLDHLPTADSRVGGMRSVAFLQTILMLIPDWADVESSNIEQHKQLLCHVVDKIMAGLDMRTDVAQFCERGALGEVNLLKLRLLSVFLFKAKSRDKAALSEGDQLLMTRTARLLIEADAFDYCRRALSTLLVFWKAQTATDRSDQRKLLPRRLASTLPDLSPLFLPQYVREHSRDVFECYTLLLTEMALRLPYQIKKVVDNSDQQLPLVVFDDQWEKLLCEYVSCQEEPNHRRQARKLLMVIAGSKDGYRFLRDKYTIAEHMVSISKLCALSVGQDERVTNLDQPLSLDYEQLSAVVEKLRSINEVAVHRAPIWQRLCAQDVDEEADSATLPFLMRLACVVPEVMSEVVLELIVGALCPSTKPSRRQKKSEDGAAVAAAETDASRPPADLTLSRKLAASLVATSVDCGLLTRFLSRYLLQSNVAERRWQAHILVRHLFDLCPAEQQTAVLDVLWKQLWPKASKHGIKASQLVDLLTVFLTKLRSVDELTTIAKSLVDMFRQDVRRIETHANANLYCSLSTFLDTEMGYYLEPSPCLVCNHPEVPMTNMKLSAVKLDSRSTTTAQIFKLTGSHELSRVTLKLSELKRNKMVKRLNLYYCNKPVGSAVELKNRPELWSKAHTVVMTAAQTEVKIEFLVPIVACNLMIEFVEFFEAQKPASELVHCPRCSASVPAHPGVCANCGENVYQCAKCRSINYDEKDPFLCNSCGYSKYAKFDFSFFGRQIASVEPIENDDGRQKMSEHIDSLLTLADNNRRQLRICRSLVEAELAALQGQVSLPPLHVDCDRAVAGEALGWSDRSKSAVFAGLNQHVHSLTMVYTSACKLCFDKLSQRIQQILANRAELVRYDAQSGETVPLYAANSYCSGEECFGCITAQAVHCLILLQGLARNATVKTTLTRDNVLVGELMTAMRKGPRKYQRSVEALIVQLCTADERGTELLCAAIEERVLAALRVESPPQALGGAIQHELSLLRLSLKVRDGLWEMRLRTVMAIFLGSLRSRHTAAPEFATLPCMELIRSIVIVSDEANKNKRPDARVEDAGGWLAAQRSGSFSAWKSNAGAPSTEAREQKLERKYGRRWLSKCRKYTSLSGCSWLERALFCHSTYTRAAAAALFKWTASGSDHRTWAIISLLISNVDKLDEYGERADEFVALARSLVADERWMLCLANRGFLTRICAMIDQEVERLGRLEDGGGASDLTEGYVVRIYAYLLSDMLAVDRIRTHWKQQVLGAVLHGYLGLRRLLIHRTKLIDDAEKKLLSLLEELTSGTEKETREFMAVCIETVQKYGVSDMRTPALIFERLCSMIDPKEKDVGDFLINIEKDPAQEDFLQGRMQGNPYNSKEAGMGPLMRDMKNRICRDCELVALLQDDTGMELLVNNKIISLDLPVAEVYRKLWQPQRSGEAMLVVYRMRGLLGDATEEFIETLDTKKDEQVDEEMVYPLAAVLGERDGLRVMLCRLRAVSATGSGRHLLTVLIKLFGYCVKNRHNRCQLIQLGAVGEFLQALRMMLETKDKSLHGHAEELLDHMSTLLVESSKLEPGALQAEEMAHATPEQIHWLLDLVVSPSVLANQSLRDRLIEIVPNLALGSESCMDALIAYFKPVLDFNQYDLMAHPQQTTIRLDTFCAMTRAVQVSAAGGVLKDKMLAADVVKDAAEYLGMHHPPLYKTTIDSPEWKEFLAKPSLKYVLRVLAGLAHGHAPSQTAIAAADCIPIVHRLEQISTEERLGSLAENVMEALRENADVANKIEAVRQETKQKKKQMAMAMRDRQLTQMGMTMGAKGQVKVSTPNLKEVPELKDEGGVVCSICREGYKSQPQKALGVYTFSKRVNVEEFDHRPIKQPGYSTVSHMNLVHFDCHQQAVKSARGREEWESAALHNANTRCNGLLPLWGAQVPDAHFAACLARFNSDIQTQTGCADVTLSSSVHDLKLLLWRFAEHKSFSEETRGGGKESNMQLVPCILSLALYMLTTARLQAAEIRHLMAFLDARPTEWMQSAYQPEGPLYMATLCLALLPCDEWKSRRVLLLRRLLVLAQARHVAPEGGSGTLPDTSVKEFSVYRSALLFFALVDAFYAIVIKSVTAPTKEKWPEALLTFVRENDAAVFDSCGELLSFFDQQVAQSESFAEFCDVVGLTSEIDNPDEFLQTTLLMT